MTELVGILNVTPDSFSDGGLFVNPGKALAQADKLFAEGASMVDVGAESTRPNATKVSFEEERERLKLVLPLLLDRYPGRISLDTYHPETAQWAFELSKGAGEFVINDVTGMNNPAMVAVITRHKARCIVSHLPGQDVQAAHSGELVNEINVVLNDLLQKAQLLKDTGILKQQIILDPGIGFGKTPELNWQLLKFAELVPDYKVMIGYSRKRFLGENRMEIGPNLAAGQIAVRAGAAYLRVHDVAGHLPLV